jgi:cyclic pyranopterin phosphate synthase
MRKKMETPSEAGAAISHLDERGAARMVDIAGKPVTLRRAVAMAEVRLGPAAWKVLLSGSASKGDVLAVARLAGIQAAKRTPDLIPLCHPLSLSKVKVDIRLVASRRVVRTEAEVECEGKTGVEMEAMTAAAVAALALYDMLKGTEKGIALGPIRLMEKTGGRSGTWKRGR